MVGKGSINKILGFAAVAEAGTGALVFLLPANAARLLFGMEISGAGILMSRVLGISLVALAVACWPGKEMRRASHGMLTYSTLVMLYLAVVGIGGSAGILLWPAVAIHAVLSVILVRQQFKERSVE